mmetsp:Transcript_815/g.1577  ORF Transcript_815/g.1577 Transcript_815/m.1577 type:complete len:478 (-) Transcript_815:474-1907(-)
MRPPRRLRLPRALVFRVFHLPRLSHPLHVHRHPFLRLSIRIRPTPNRQRRLPQPKPHGPRPKRPRQNQRLQTQNRHRGRRPRRPGRGHGPRRRGPRRGDVRAPSLRRGEGLQLEGQGGQPHRDGTSRLLRLLLQPLRDHEADGQFRHGVADEGARAHLRQRGGDAGQFGFSISHRGAGGGFAGLCADGAAGIGGQVPQRGEVGDVAHREGALRLRRGNGHGARSRRYFLHRVVHATGGESRIVGPDVGPHRLRLGIRGLRSHLGALHAHHLHALRHPDRGQRPQDARGESADLPSRPDFEIPRRSGSHGPHFHRMPRTRLRHRRERQTHPRHGDQSRTQRRTQRIRRGGLRPRRAGHQKGPSPSLSRSLPHVRQHLPPRHRTHRHGASQIRRMGHGNERRRSHDGRVRRSSRRTRRGDRQPPLLRRCRILMLRRSGGHFPRGILQARRRIPHPGRLRRTGLRSIQRPNRPRLHRTIE